MSEIEGKWLLKEVTGVAEFCEALQKAIPQEEHHTVEYRKDADSGEWTQTFLFGNNFLQALWLMDYGPQKFKSGEQFGHKDLSGSDSKSTIIVEGNRVTHTQLYGEGDEQIEITLAREFNGDKMTTTITFKDNDGQKEPKMEGQFVKVA